MSGVIGAGATLFEILCAGFGIAVGVSVVGSVGVGCLLLLAG
jgi:hypothetical protein